MRVKVMIFCVGCVLVMSATSAADEPTEAPAILSALGTQSGVTVVSEADLAQIEGTGPLPFWNAQWRANLRSYLMARRAMRIAMIRARIARWRGGGEVPGDGGDSGGGEIPEMAE